MKYSPVNPDKTLLKFVFFVFCDIMIRIFLMHLDVNLFTKTTHHAIGHLRSNSHNNRVSLSV